MQTRPRLLGAAAVAVGAITLAAAGTNLNSPTGTRGVFMVDKRGGHIRFFDPTTLKELRSVHVGSNPHDFAFSPDHKMAYAPIYGDGVYNNNPHPGRSLAIFDLALRDIAGTIDLSPCQGPHGIQVDSNGMLYVTCDISRTVHVVNGKTRTVDAVIENEGTGHWLALAEQVGKLYVTNKTDRPFISVIDVKARKIVARVPAPNGTEGIAASPDGRRVLAVDHSEPSLIVISTETDTVVDRIPLKSEVPPFYKVWYSPDGSKVLVIAMRGQVNILDARNLRGEQKVITTSGKNPMGLGFSPDGKAALLGNDGDGTVTVLDLEKAQVIRTFQAGVGIETLGYY
jgi:DNA-binding beta-propeller fold protein YncE